jgi:hypothetical protein
MLRRSADVGNLQGRPQTASARAQRRGRFCCSGANELCGGPSRTLVHASHDGRHGGPGGDHGLDHADLSYVACADRRKNDGGLSFSWRTEAAWAGASEVFRMPGSNSPTAPPFACWRHREVRTPHSADDNILSSAPRAVPQGTCRLLRPEQRRSRLSDILPHDGLRWSRPSLTEGALR